MTGGGGRRLCKGPPVDGHLDTGWHGRDLLAIVEKVNLDEEQNDEDEDDEDENDDDDDDDDYYYY